ncbi:MAG: hypothetical protein DHS20C08_18340 [Rhodomicrobium sp.]|nr:MAG: hypothetical protein DHS20C08_18340 [Rhodomicrobium sp.]
MYIRCVTFKVIDNDIDGTITAADQLRDKIKENQLVRSIEVVDLGDGVCMNLARYDSEADAAEAEEKTNQIYQALSHVIDLSSINVVQGPVVWTL